MGDGVKTSIEELVNMLKERAKDGIIEPATAELLIKHVLKADSLLEAIEIAELGTAYRKTGVVYDVRHEKIGDTIKYLKKNEALSFSDGSDKPHHKLIIGDNYDALQNLLISYRGSIDVIYIDPPYGKDDMGGYADTNYENAITRDNLLSMLYPRLLLARELLSENGFIFCSIDDKNYAYVKCLFDDVFGESCFVNTFVWQKNSSEKTDKSQFTVNTEYVLFYSKHHIRFLHDTYKPLSKASIDLYRFDDGDGRGKYASVSLQKPKDPGPDTTFDYVDNSGKVWPCPPKGWRMNQSKIKALENDNRLILSGKNPRVKDYWNERPNTGKRIDTLWNDLPQNSAGSIELESIIKGSVFKNPKPFELIKRCVDIQDENAIVLDFFAGSGTTGQAVLELNKDGGNRIFILCTNNEKTDLNPNGIAYDVTSKRLKRIMTGECYDGSHDFDWIKDNTPFGDSLDVYEIADVANFQENPDESPFDVIDEVAYGLKPFDSIQDKVAWVCSNFDRTQKYLEGEE